MIDDRTHYLKLPLPHPDNFMRTVDVPRLREAITELSKYVDVWTLGGESATYAYDADGNITEVTELVRGYPRTATYTYDPAGNITQAALTYRGVLRTETYTYDDAGNIIGQSATEAPL